VSSFPRSVLSGSVLPDRCSNAVGFRVAAAAPLSVCRLAAANSALPLSRPCSMKGRLS
jgi:hypothetical protein